MLAAGLMWLKREDGTLEPARLIARSVLAGWLWIEAAIQGVLLIPESALY